MTTKPARKLRRGAQPPPSRANAAEQRTRGNRSDHGHDQRSLTITVFPRSRSRRGKSLARRSRSRRSWADRRYVGEGGDGLASYSNEVEFSDSETEVSRAKVVEVSERTAKFLQEKCTRRVLNSGRKDVNIPS